MQKEQYYTEIEKLVHKKRSLRCSLVTVGLKDTQGKKVCREILVKTFIQALQECQNTKMKKIHLGNQKFPPSTGRPNCQNQAVWPACVRWQTCDSLDDFFTICILQTHSESFLVHTKEMQPFLHFQDFKEQKSSKCKEQNLNTYAM